LNIDENPMTPSKYGVRGIPTFMLFKHGQAAAIRIGAMAKGSCAKGSCSSGSNRCCSMDAGLSPSAVSSGRWQPFGSRGQQFAAP
jgi:hypothetical protein